jgi:transposase-like protein
MGPPVVLSAEERSFREAQVRRHKAARPLSEGCRIVLLCAEDLRSKEVPERLGVHEHTVGKWRRRFVKDRIEGLTDGYRPGRPRTVMDAQVAEVIERRLHTTPKDATHYLECRCTPRAAAGKSSAASGKAEARHRRNGA